MRLLKDALAICRMELSLFRRFPKLRFSALGVMVIPAVYALIYLGSVRDPSLHTDRLKAGIVNLDEGLNYRGQQVNMGQSVTASVKDRHTFGYVDYQVEDDAKLAVRLGELAFALIIPKDFSAGAVPGQAQAGGRLILYVSEGNNYNGANLAKRFAAELGHQANNNLNETRWSLALETATGSIDKLAQLRKGAASLYKGAQQLDVGLSKAQSGAKTLADGSDGLSHGIGQLTDGVKQLGVGLRTMDQQQPKAQDLTALKSGASDLVAGHAVLVKGLGNLQIGAQKLAEGSAQMVEETKNIPIVGARISGGATQLNTGAKQLATGIQTAQVGQTQLADGAQQVQVGVDKVTDGMTALGKGLHTAATKVPPDATLDGLTQGGVALAAGAQNLQDGLQQLQSGSRELSAGLDLLNHSLPADMLAPDGNAKGMADSVAPVLNIVAPVPNNGAGFAPNFLATSLWLGAVMTAFLFHLRRLPQGAMTSSAPARLIGKMGILASIVILQSVFILLMALLALELPVARIGPFCMTLVLSGLTFLTIILALTRAFGDAGKGVALLLMVLQLSSAGGVLPVELAGGIYQVVSPWLPFTWVVKALRASMFDAYDGNWFSPWLNIGLMGAIAWLFACFVGRWKFVTEADHRPAMDV